MGVFTGPSSTGPTVAASILQGKRIYDVGDKIAELEPDVAPLLRFCTPTTDSRGSFRKRSVPGVKYTWLEQAGMPIWDTAHGTHTSATTTSLVVHEGSYYGAGYSVYVPRTGALVNVESVGSVSTTTTLTITSYNFNTTGANANLADNEPLLILGHTAVESDTSPIVLLNQESQPYNYIEIVKTALGASDAIKASQLYGGSDLDAQRRYKAIEHQKQIEYRLLCGVRAEAGTTDKHKTGGLLDSASIGISTNSTTDTGTFTEAEWNTWLSTWFRYGSSQKVAFCSASVVAAINEFATGKIRINDIATKKYGLDIREFLSPYGTCYIVYHKLLEGTTFGKMAIGVDMENVKYCFLNGLDTKLEMNIQANDASYEKDQFITYMGLQLTLEKTHAKLVIA